MAKVRPLHSVLYTALALVAVFLLLPKGRRPTAVSADKTPQKISLPQQPARAPNGMSVPWAITYSPYAESGACKAPKTIAADLSDMAGLGVQAVRLFSVDCGVLSALQKVPLLDAIVGIHPNRDPSAASSDGLAGFRDSLDEQLTELARWNRWHRVPVLVVGSQGVYSGAYSQAELVHMIKYVRSWLETQPGFRALITTAEPVESWASSNKFNAASKNEYRSYRANADSGVEYVDVEDNDLCHAVDAVGLVAQPFFNSLVEPQDVATLVQRDVQFAGFLCSDDFIARAHSDSAFDEAQLGSNSAPKQILVLEAGWPSAGDTNGHAVPSVENQREAVDELISMVDLATSERLPVAIYSFENEPWRDPGLFDVEVSFGVKHLYH